MNWTQFLGALTAIYVTYYLLNVLFDLIRNGRTKATPDTAPQLTFSDDGVPTPVAADEYVSPAEMEETSPPIAGQALSSGPLQSTGGVGIRDLFALAQSDLIQFTGAIPY